MKRVCVFAVVLTMLTAMFAPIPGAMAMEQTPPIINQNFDTQPVRDVNFTNAGNGEGADCVAVHDPALAHTGEYLIKRSNRSGDTSRGIKLLGLLDDVVTQENIGKFYVASMYIYVPSSGVPASAPKQNFLVSIVEPTGTEHRRYGGNYGVPADTWTKVSMTFEVGQDIVDLGSTALRICQRGMMQSAGVCAEFYIDDISICGLTDIDLPEKAGFTLYAEQDFDKDGLTFTANTNPTSDPYVGDFTVGGGQSAGSVKLDGNVCFSYGKSLSLSSRAAGYYRVKLANLFPTHFTSDDLFSAYRVTARVMAQDFKDPNSTNSVVLSAMTDASTDLLASQSFPLKAGVWQNVEFIFTIDEAILAATQNFPLRLGYESSGNAIPSRIYIDDIKVEKAVYPVQLPSIYADGMVFQREQPITISGYTKTDADEQITVSLKNEAGDTLRTGTVTSSNRNWSVTFDALDAMKNLTLEITGDSGKMALTDIAIGEVWLCSGQSNMQKNMGYVTGADAYIEDCENHDVRFMDMRNYGSFEIEDNAQGATWYRVNQENISGVTAIGYMFAAQMEEHLGVTVGIIDNYYGGSNISSWVSMETLESKPEFASFIADYEAKKANPPADASDRSKIPTYFYNAMTHPVTPLNIRGVLWYQGESDSGSNAPNYYANMLNSLIAQWRDDFRNPTLPVMLFQLPPMTTASWPVMRQIQLDVAKWDENVHLVVAANEGPTGLETEGAVHPTYKTPLAERAAMIAKARVYDSYVPFTGEYMGPEYISMTVSGDTAVLSFAHTGTGMKTSDGEALKGFEISADGTSFVPATAVIKGDTIEVTGIANPVAVRYSYISIDEATSTLGGNLTNDTNIPASPFVATLFAPSAMPYVVHDKNGSTVTELTPEIVSEGFTVYLTLSNTGYSEGTPMTVAALYDGNRLVDVKVAYTTLYSIGGWTTQFEFSKNTVSDPVVKCFSYSGPTSLSPIS